MVLKLRKITFTKTKKSKDVLTRRLVFIHGSTTVALTFNAGSHELLNWTAVSLPCRIALSLMACCVIQYL